MGRNADKKKRRHGDVGDEGGSVDAGAVPSAPPSASPAFHEGSPSWVQRSLHGPADVPAHDVDGTLAQALFHLTCLLSVRDAKGPRPENLARVASEIASMVQADTVTLLRLAQGDDMVPAHLTLLASHGLAHADAALVKFDLDDGIAGAVARTGELVRIEDAPRDARFHRLYGQRTEIGSMVAVPLRFGRRVLGVLTASRREIRAFSVPDEELLSVVGDSIAQDLEQTRLFYEAVTDPLTGLYSRLALLTTLPREVEVARRYRTDLSLLMFDLDGLRSHNQAGGRSGGDRVLVESGRRLSAAVRSADLPVRFGADALAVLLPMTTSNNARATAKRLVKALAAPLPGADAPLRWTCVCATLAADDEDALGLLWRADRALMEAKAQGGDRIVTAPVKGAAR